MSAWSWRDEFRWKSFTLQHGNANDFAFSRWQRNGRVKGWFILYRSFLVALLLSIVLSSFFVYGWSYWFIYLTDLGVLVQTIHFAVSAAAVVARLFIERDADGSQTTRMTALDRASWIFYYISTSGSIVITCTYWGLLYDSEKGIDVMDFMVHGVNSIVTVVDLFISGRPWRLMHFHMAILALALYVIFSIIYWAADGVNLEGCNYIYSVLDWNDPVPTLILVVEILAVMLPLHALFWVFHLLRDYLANRISAHFMPSYSPSVAFDNPIFVKVDGK